METLPRTQFVLYANAVWFAQFVAEFLVTLAPDAAVWQQRAATSLQVGCVGDTASYVPLDRLYLFALAWILTAPLMTVIALRCPERWPERTPTPLWNKAAPGASFVTLAAVAVLLIWPLGTAVATPITGVFLVEATRGTALLITALHYRGVILA